MLFRILKMNTMKKKEKKSRKVLIQVNSRKILFWDILARKNLVLMKDVQWDSPLMKNNLWNKKKLYISYLLLMFFLGLFILTKYKIIILSYFTHNYMRNIKIMIIKSSNKFLNRLSFINNNYNNSRLPIFKDHNFNYSYKS